ncbi:MAG: hypothetical protein WC962_10020 [Phycisphaerae bacterium]|jgi:hypothetical protein
MIKNEMIISNFYKAPSAKLEGSAPLTVGLNLPNKNPKSAGSSKRL